VSTGLGDLAGTTADALCRAARSGSRVQRTFIAGKQSFPAGAHSMIRDPLLYPTKGLLKSPQNQPVFSNFGRHGIYSFLLITLLKNISL
jgi:hypothetical protein